MINEMTGGKRDVDREKYECPCSDGSTHPNFNVIGALVVLLVEDLKVVSSGRDQAEGK